MDFEALNNRNDIHPCAQVHLCNSVRVISDSAKALTNDFCVLHCQIVVQTNLLIVNYAVNMFGYVLQTFVMFLENSFCACKTSFSL
jgi:hypothetical protein